jgi:predicted ATPase/DNA-binding SARP family transcriptional activator
MASVAPSLQIALFGPFRACVNGQPLPRLRSRKGHWLLALLALRAGCSLDRAWLAGTLWPDSSHPQALANLRNTLKDLRQALGPEAHRLHSPTSRSLLLDLSGVEVDAVAFDAAITRGGLPSLEQAVALYRGPLLEGCEEEWVAEERRTRERAYLAALEALADDARTRGDLAAAERALRQAVAADPLRESAQRALIETLAAGGSAASAMQVYRELRELLYRELNAEPAPETQALFQQLRSDARHRVQTPRPVPSGATVSRVSNNLPHQLTRFIGREQEVAKVSQLLATHRLVTLTGTGGCGKTRLAIQVAAGQLAGFTHGVYFVNLAPIRDTGLAASTIAQTLDLRESADRPLVKRLKEYLREKQLLLLLDNFEQVLAAAPLVAELLAAAEQLTVLITSRAALRVRGEQEYSVPPLALPDPADRLSAEALSQCAAVALFADRAAEVRAGFAVTAENAAAVAEICCRLDGLPLAIELAAARVRFFPPQALLARLGNRLALLMDGARDVPARQQTLRSAIGWSYDLLEEPERRLFRRLSVFVGGFTLEAAEAVCCPRDDLDEAILEGVGALADQNLLRREEDTEGEPRFGMLETIREYGRECLAASGEMEAFQRRHAEHYLALAEAAEPALHGAEQTAWLDRLEREHDNLRAALAWSVMTGDARTGLWLGGALQFFWLVRGHLREGRVQLARLLALPNAAEHRAARAKVLQRSASLAWRQGDYKTARAVLEESLVIHRTLQNQQGIAESLGALGYCVQCLGDIEAAQAFLTESLTISRELRDRHGIAGSLGNLGHIALDQEEYDTARALYEEGLAIRRELGSRHGIAASLQNLGKLALARGHAGDAHARYSEALDINRALGNRPWEAVALIALGEAALALGEVETARELCDQGLAISRELGDRAVTADALNTLGRIVSGLGDLGAARTHFTESASLCRRLGIPTLFADCLEGFAVVLRAWGGSERAARLFGSVQALRDMSRTPRLPWLSAQYAEHVAALRAELGEKAFAEAWEAGRAMSLEEAIRVALEDEIPTAGGKDS